MILQLEDYLTDTLGVRTEIIDELLSLGHPFSMQAGEGLLLKGYVSDRAYFIERGVVREYKDFEVRKEKTTWLMAEGNWLYNIESFQKNTPSRCYLQALEPTSGFYFMKKDLDDIAIRSHEWSLIRNEIYQTYILRQEKRTELHGVEKAQRRLELYHEIYPELRGQVMLHQVASFLNISASHLSRLRGRN